MTLKMSYDELTYKPTNILGKMCKLHLKVMDAGKITGLRLKSHYLTVCYHALLKYGFPSQ